MNILDKFFFGDIKKQIDNINIDDVEKCLLIIKKLKKNNKIILCGNGASASISSHISVDFTKSCNIRSVCFNEPNLITCFANDYGYEKWLSESIKKFAIKNDILILISSSGKSKNIIEAAKIAKKQGLKIISLSGFSKNNPLKKMGDVNIHINSNNYNIIEVMHLAFLCSITEKLKKNI